MFSQMSLKLHEAGHLVATLLSKDCPNLKATAKSMIEQFIGSERGVVDEDVDEVAPLDFAPVESKSARLPNYDMQILDCWYRQIRKTGNLVVIIPDFECFPSFVLESLIAICSEYQDRLPIVFLLGIATTIESLHQSLPRSVLALLRTEKFKLQNSQECINAVVEEILIKPSRGFRFGEDAYTHLLEVFHLHSLSIRSFVRSIHYALIDYYYGNSLSILTDLEEPADDGVLDMLNEMHAYEIRVLKSFRKYVESNLEADPDEVRCLLTDDPYLFNAIPTFLNNIQQYHVEFAAGFACLVVVQGTVNLPSYRRPKRTLHKMALSENLGETAYVGSLLQVLRKRKLSDLLSCLHQCLTLLQSTSSSHPGTCSEVEELSTIITDAERFEGSDEESSSSDDEDYLLKYGRKRSVPTISLSQGRQTNVAKRLKPIEEKLEKGGRAEWCKGVAEFFVKFFKRTLKCYTEMPLHELVYYNNASRLKKAFNPQPRAAVQTALGNTQHYLSCECCSKDRESATESIEATSQDATIAYKLYLECGRMINLYDWFVAFGTIVEKEGGGLEQSVVQARFIQAITELQLTGFIRPTSRKTDHVLRLTWGCLLAVDIIRRSSGIGDYYDAVTAKDFFAFVPCFLFDGGSIRDSGTFSTPPGQTIFTEFTDSDDNHSLRGFCDALQVIVSTPYLIGAITPITLNLILPFEDEIEEVGEEEVRIEEEPVSGAMSFVEDPKDVGVTNVAVQRKRIGVDG
ncbi:Origin recognition complex subunit 3 [Rhizophlyctis rosea]|uniref:Origin recognition complex subunit 3 n=1 Tax=Rhizophlyctis rosea TaxID=64517 RepID=A0AAD5X5M1_9FUNG|nr:Origin recognition complex subunit 3 [Rhizophlyctis rosea]